MLFNSTSKFSMPHIIQSRLVFRTEISTLEHKAQYVALKQGRIIFKHVFEFARIPPQLQSVN